MSRDSSQDTGLAFSCRRCGECCRGRGGIVLDRRDQERLCAHLGMTREAFLARYAEVRGGKIHLTVDQEERCVFHRGEDCGVHEARPDICLAWPYFRGNLVDASSWEMAWDSCPGLNREVSHGEFVRQGLEYLRARELLRPGGDDRPEALRLDKDL